MRFVFVYTDSNAPAVASLEVTKIEETTTSANVKNWTVTYPNGNTSVFSENNGRPAILWE